MAFLIAGFLANASIAGAQSTSPGIPAPVRAAAESITEAQVARYVSYLGSDALRGRVTLSAGLDSAVAFVARQVAGWQLRPAGDSGGYLQRYPIERVTIDTARTYLELRGRRFYSPTDFRFPFMEPKSGTVTGQVAFVGHGVSVPSRGIDPYAGVAYQDKILLLWGPEIPAGLTPGEWGDGKTAIRDNWWKAPADLWIPRFWKLAEWWRALGRGQVVQEWIRPPVKSEEAGSNRWIEVGPTVVEALLDSLPTNSSAVFGRSLAGEPPASFALPPDRAISLTIATKAQVFRPANVVALVEGSDPQLKNEFVTIQAHLDGIVNWIQQPDTIGNAADDNASGVAALLAVAEAFSRAPRPKRSVLFLWDTGEEQGNFGTQHFIASNAIPIEKIAAHFNLDMIGRSGEAGDHDPKGETLTGLNEVYVIGPRSLSTGLKALIDGVNDSYRGIEYNHSHDTWDNQWMYRGEHLWFIKKGIPSALYFSGMHREYHNTSDNPGLINSSKVTRVARTVFVTTWMVANAQTRPRIDKPLPPNVKP